jgi:hypothetical protein
MTGLGIGGRHGLPAIDGELDTVGRVCRRRGRETRAALGAFHAAAEEPFVFDLELYAAFGTRE